MDRKPVTRKELQRALVVNAATKPVNVAVPAAVVVLGLILGTVWLVPVAVLVYAALVVVTFFDGGEADKVADRLYGRDPAALKRAEETRARKVGEYAPEIADLLENALSQEQAIRRVIVESDLPFDEVSAEVDQLVRAMEKIADRAQKVYAFLETQDRERAERRLGELRAGDDDLSDTDRAQLVKALEDQLQAIDALQRQLTRFRAEMEHTTTTLHTIYAQLVQMSVATDAVGEQQVAEQLRSLREQVGAASQSIAEVFDENTPAELSA
jgi:hypothetical protein